MQDKFKGHRSKSICLHYFTVFVTLVWLINSYHALEKISELLHAAEQHSLPPSIPDYLHDHVL